MTELVQVSTAIDSESAAREMAERLVNERLAACVQILGPMTSVYRWNDALERSTEWLCVAKTTSHLVGSVMSRIRALHSYQRPEILATSVHDADPGYRGWVADCVAGR